MRGGGCGDSYRPGAIMEMKCQDCDRTNPECGWYPMLWLGYIDPINMVMVGGQLCWDCDKKRRENVD